MNSDRHEDRHLDRGAWSTSRISLLFLTGVGVLALVALMACGQKLPEPESPAAQLYVQYCSGSGCHDPIPPQVDSKGYWDNQYQRMIVLMRDRGLPLPSQSEDAMIREYLAKNASQ